MVIGRGFVEGGSMIVVAEVMGYKGEKGERRQRKRERERDELKK